MYMTRFSPTGQSQGRASAGAGKTPAHFPRKKEANRDMDTRSLCPTGDSTPQVTLHSQVSSGKNS